MWTVSIVSGLQGQTEDELKEVFGAYGTIKDTHMPKTKSSGLTKGFAFIEYENSANTDAYVPVLFLKDFIV